MENCPCGNAKHYISCCGRFIKGTAIPETPEELMRSRYTAYTMADISYIKRTMQSPAADHFDSDAAQQWAANVEWLKLEVLNSKQDATKGYVEFVAHFKEQNKLYTMHELSEFHFENGHWYYVDGKNLNTQTPATRIGRNDICLCGSRKKYKKCCGR